jgi:uncharacterized membrane protein YdjX (TVP38/TMEM64 family)
MLLATVLLAATIGWLLPLDSLADAEWWRQQLARCELWCHEHPVAFTLGFALVFAALSAFTLPGCSVLSLMAGPLFGAVFGTLLVGVASTLGATASFLAARHLVRPAAQARFGYRLQPIEAFLARHGSWSLFMLRLVPVVPFPVLNPMLGITRMPLRAFLMPSLAGLTLGTVPYVWLGLSAQRIGSPSPAEALPLAAGALLLLASLWWLRRRMQKAVTP